MKGGFLLSIILLCLLNAAWLNLLNQKYDCPASVRVKRDRYRHVLIKKFNKIPCAGDIGKCVYIFNLQFYCMHGETVFDPQMKKEAKEYYPVESNAHYINLSEHQVTTSVGKEVAETGEMEHNFRLTTKSKITIQTNTRVGFIINISDIVFCIL